MFEDIKQPPDMFSETDKAENVPPPFRPPKPPVAAPAVPPLAPLPVSPSLSQGGGNEGFPTRRFSARSIVIVLAAVVIIVLGALLSTRILGNRTPVTESLANIAGSVTEESVNTSKTVVPTESEVKTKTQVESEQAVELDTDKDGLSDERETRLGTSVRNSDTDDDGLFDREEADVYKTDPLNPDTDGDGYLDGSEVKSGYNPNGAGKLFELPGND